MSLADRLESVRRSQQPEAVSTNPAHKPIVLAPGEDPDIIGRVRKTVLTM